MSEALIPVRTRLLQAVRTLCVTEAGRLGVNDFANNNSVYVTNIPGVAEYPIELREVHFADNGKPIANMLGDYLKRSDLPRLQILSAIVIADRMGFTVSASVEPEHYQHSWCLEVADMIIAATGHDHDICVKSTL